MDTGHSIPHAKKTNTLHRKITEAAIPLSHVHVHTHAYTQATTRRFSCKLTATLHTTERNMPAPLSVIINYISLLTWSPRSAFLSSRILLRVISHAHAHPVELLPADTWPIAITASSRQQDQHTLLDTHTHTHTRGTEKNTTVRALGSQETRYIRDTRFSPER